MNYRLEKMTTRERADVDCPNEVWDEPLYKVVNEYGRMIGFLLNKSQALRVVEELQFYASYEE